MQILCMDIVVVILKVRDPVTNELRNHFADE